MHVVNFKSAYAVLLEILSRGPNLPIFDVRWTPLLSGCYKLNIDTTSPVKGVSGILPLS